MKPHATGWPGGFRHRGRLLSAVGAGRCLLRIPEDVGSHWPLHAALRPSPNFNPVKLFLRIRTHPPSRPRRRYQRLSPVAAEASAASLCMWLIATKDKPRMTTEASHFCMDPLIRKENDAWILRRSYTEISSKAVKGRAVHRDGCHVENRRSSRGLFRPEQRHANVHARTKLCAEVN